MNTVNLKDLNKIDLELRNFAIDTVKYQNFKTKVAISKIDCKLTQSTKQNYFDAGLRYIKTKIKQPSCSKKFFQYIEEALQNHIQPLTPSEKDKRRVIKKIYYKKDAELPVNNVIKTISKENYTEKFEYGVRVKDTVKVFKTREQANFFLEGVLFGGEDIYNARIVSVQNLGE